MTLTEYLAANNLTASAFAERLDVPPSTVIRLIKGERSPRLELLRKIMAATDGEVTPNDFVGFDADEVAQ